MRARVLSAILACVYVSAAFAEGDSAAGDAVAKALEREAANQVKLQAIAKQKAALKPKPEEESSEKKFISVSVGPVVSVQGSQTAVGGEARLGWGTNFTAKKGESPAPSTYDEHVRIDLSGGAVRTFKDGEFKFIGSIGGGGTLNMNGLRMNSRIELRQTPNIGTIEVPVGFPIPVKSGATIMPYGRLQFAIEETPWLIATSLGGGVKAEVPLPHKIKLAVGGEAAMVTDIEGEKDFSKGKRDLSTDRGGYVYRGLASGHVPLGQTAYVKVEASVDGRKYKYLESDGAGGSAPGETEHRIEYKGGVQVGGAF